MEYAQTAHNRSVYAAPPVGGLASIRLGHGLRHSHASFRHIFPALQMLRSCLFGRSKRRKQPKRYVQYALKLVGKLWKKLLENS
jgi:hypothetical protein